MKSLFFVLFLLIVASGCNSAETAPVATSNLDGNWNLKAVQCGGAAVEEVQPYLSKINISGGSGTLTVRLFRTSPSLNCTVTSPETITYPVDGQVTLTPGETQCSVASCISSCGKTESPLTFSITRTGNSAVLETAKDPDCGTLKYTLELTN